MSDTLSRFTAGTSDSVALLMLDTTIKATVLLLAALLASTLLYRTSAAVRHRLWCLVFAGLLLLPVLTALLPGWRVPILPWVLQSETSPTAPVVENTSNLMESDYGTLEDPSIAMRESIFNKMPGDVDSSLLETETQANSKPSEEINPPTVSHNEIDSTGETTSAISWPLLSSIVWLLGACIAALPLILSPPRTRLLARGAREIEDPQASGLLREFREKLGVRRNVRLLETDRPLIPMTWGVLRPVLLFPVTWRNWSPQRRQFVLLHELAHVKRHDVAFQLLARTVCALYWFHPLAWYALRRMRIERELACDDCVLIAGQRPSDYAQQLLDIARTHHLPSIPTAVAMARTKRLESRVRAVLDQARSRMPLSRGVARFFLVSAALVVTLLAVVQPAARSASEGESSDDVAEATSLEQDVDEAASKSEESPMDRQALLALAQQNQFQDGKVVTLEPIHGTISGRGGRSVSGAKVYLREHPNSWQSWGRNTPTETRDLAATVSNDKGQFRFENIKSKPLHILRKDVLPVDVIVVAEGYAAAWCRLSQCEAADFQLKPGARVHGHIVDEKQEPAKGTAIRVLRFVPLTEIANMDLAQHVYPRTVGNTLDLACAGFQIATTVDEQGRFELSGLPQNSGTVLEVSDPGHYREVIYTTPNPNHPVWRESAHLSMPSPSSYYVIPPHANSRLLEEERKRSRFGLRESVQISPIKIALHRGIRLRVRVVDDETGNPISGARLPEAPIFTYPAQGITDDTGVYEYTQLEPGILSFQISPPEGSKCFGARAKIELAKEDYETETEVRLPRGAVVAGKVIDRKTGRGIPGARVYYVAKTGNTTAVSVKTDQQGRFHIVGQPGEGQLILYSAVPGYETPISSGSILEAPQRFKRSVNVTPDAPQTDIVFELVPDVLFHGRTLDRQGKPVGGVKITGKIPRGDNSYMPLEQQSDGRGRYVLTGFYADVLQKRRPKIPILFQDESRGLVTRVTFTSPTDGSKLIERDIQLQPAGIVTGRVINKQTDKPIVGASVSVHLWTDTGGQYIGGTKTDQQGRYTYRLLVPDAEHTVEIRAKGYVISDGRSAFSKHFVVKAGETRTMPDIQMTQKAVAESTADIPKAEPPKVDGLSSGKALELLLSRFQEDRKAYRKRLDETTDRNEKKKIVARLEPTGAYSRSFMNLANDNIDSDVELKSLIWICKASVVAGTDSTDLYRRKKEATRRLLEKYIDRKEIVDCLGNLVYRSGKPLETAQLLMDKSPHREVKGRACLLAAQVFEQDIDSAYRSGEQPSEKARGQAIKFYRQVISDYADISQWRHGTIGEQAEKALNQLENLWIGQKAPDIIGRDLDGKPMKLSDYRGKIVVLAFTCQIEWWSGLARTIEEFNNDDQVVVLGVYAGPDREAARKAAAKHNIPWRIWFDGPDEQGPIVSAWNNTSWPNTHVIDQKDVIRYRNVDRNRLRTAIETLWPEPEG
ncbi:MAG: carboxypeptidase regulatory-like domain-containing protein [Pirellulales bacterium]|nr:carboxypeptidase regulatory-like domain-containing protein [Pirellulales bacterium]